MTTSRIQHALCGVAFSLGVAFPLSSQPAPIAPRDRFPYAPGIDVQRYDLSMILPERGAEVRAVATITVARAREVDTLRLDLVGMTIDRVSVNGQQRDVVRDSTAVRIPLRRADGTRLSVIVRYHGTPTDGLIVREDSTRGWSAFGDNWPNRARYWIPSVDHPSDKAIVQWTVTAPSARAVIANGTQVSRLAVAPPSGATGKWSTTRYRMSQPVPTYLMVIGVARMQSTPLGRTACGSGTAGACVPQSVWTFPQETALQPANFREAGRIVSTFAKLAGPFAYDRLAHVQSATRFGGMENATAIFYSDKAFRDNTLGVELIAHETAHQWFGDAVTPRRWADLWLSEGFATYFAALYTRQSRGDSAFLATMQRIRGEIMAAPIVAQRPVVDSVGADAPLTLLNANSYQKGGFVLHMLRARVGDSVFFASLREYQRRFRHATATTDELREILERRSKTSHAEFFDQWLHRPGWADYAITWTWRADNKSLVLAIMQGTRFAPFAAPLTLRLRDQAGQTRDVVIDIRAEKQQLITLPLTNLAEIVEIIADPQVRLLGRVEMLHAMP